MTNVVDLDHFRARILQDAMAEAEVDYWLSRAETFAAVGSAKCDEIAQACRNKALFLYAEARGISILDALDAGWQIRCRTCATSTSPWTCSCGMTRIGGAA